MSGDKLGVMETKGSYYVRLPVDWAKRHGLAKGDKLRLYYSDQPALTAIPSGSPLKPDGFTAQRSLTLFGSSLYFTLPMSWCRRYHVNEESTLRVEEMAEGEALLYSAEKLEEKVND